MSTGSSRPEPASRPADLTQAFAPPSEDRVGHYRRLQAAVEELLILRGITTPAEVEAHMAWLDSRDWRRGARMVARAWVDEGYRRRMLENGAAAAEEIGLEVGPLHLIVVENTPSVHNVIVCTLCSCYPRSLLGTPPAWYKSAEYRSRVVREPRQVLAEFGLELPDSTEIRVHDSSADMRYMVFPMRPSGTQGWSEERLAELVTGESIVGTGVPRAGKA